MDGRPQIHTFKGESAFGSWVYRIAANAAYQKLRWRRRKAKEIALDDVLPALDGEGRHFEPMEDWSNRVDELALQGELREVLTDAIEALPAEYRTVLVLHDVEGAANPEIAETLGLSLPAVKSRIHRARLFVRKRLSAYLGSDGVASTNPAASVTLRAAPWAFADLARPIRRLSGRCRRSSRGGGTGRSRSSARQSSLA